MIRTARFEFTPNENEQIDTIIKITEKPQSIIHGIVKDYNNQIIINASVSLYEYRYNFNEDSLISIDSTFTDKKGEFMFGPLCPNKDYLIKITTSSIKIRKLVINANGCFECQEIDDCFDAIDVENNDLNKHKEKKFYSNKDTLFIEHSF